VSSAIEGLLTEGRLAEIEAQVYTEIEAQVYTDIH
jgi:hypothetical protein